MLIDAQLLFSKSQTVTADAGSTNVVDLGIARNLFDGEPMAVVIAVETAADVADGNETYEFQIECDSTAAFSSPADLVVQSIDGAALVAGSVHVLPIPQGVECEQFLRVYYNVGGTTPSVKVSAFLQPQSAIGKYKAYADGITIS